MLSVDVHNPMGRGYDMRFINIRVRHTGYHTGVLCPAKVENLLVAGRCISAIFMQSPQYVFQAPVWQIREAAGTAAACLWRKRYLPRRLDVKSPEGKAKRPGSLSGTSSGIKEKGGLSKKRPPKYSSSLPVFWQAVLPKLSSDPGFFSRSSL